jgi:hypothetical protein
MNIPRVFAVHNVADQVAEPLDYLEGVLWADPAHRLDMDPARNVSREIDPWGTGTKAFWRGVLESAGYIGLNGAGDRQYPRLELAGSYHFLLKFVDFLAEELADNLAWPDTDKKLRFAASGGRLRLSAARAQDAIRALYVGETIGQDSVRARVDSILVWTGRA